MALSCSDIATDRAREGAGAVRCSGDVHPAQASGDEHRRVNGAGCGRCSAVHQRGRLEAHRGGEQGRENAYFAPFYTQNDHFTKTGSGQTQGRLKRDAFFSQIGAYQLFIPAETPTQFVGQYIGLVVATSLSVARRAALLVDVKYALDPSDMSSSTGAVTSIEEAVAAGRPMTTEFPAVACDPTYRPETRMGADAPATISGSMATNGQKHFYMETDSTLAIPTTGAQKKSAGFGAHFR